MTFIFLDVETTGLDPKESSIIQLAGIIKQGNQEEHFNYKMAPYHHEAMSKMAAEKTGITTEEAYTYPNQKIAFNSFKRLCNKYVKSYKEKMYLIGYNVSFDDEFMREWFSINNEKWGYEVWFPYIDVMTLAGLYTLGKRPSLKNFQLTTVYEFLIGHPFEEAHNAMADILATKELFEKLTVDLMLKPQKFIPSEETPEGNSEGSIKYEIPF